MLDIFFVDIPSVLETIKDEDESFVIGGASIYKQFLEYAQRLYLTEVNEECLDATVYFPTFNKKLYKKKILGYNNDNGIKYKFCLYEKK